VVVCAPGVPVDDVAAILGLAEDGRLGICALAMPNSSGAALSAAYRLRAAPTIEVFGTTVEPQSMDSSEFEQAGALLRTAQVLDVGDDADIAGDTDEVVSGDVSNGTDPDLPVRSVKPTVTAYQSPMSGAASRVATGRRRPGPVPTSEVEVAVLGPVEVRGADRAFTRAWALELVVYLAMHPGGTSNDVWATALWPDKLMAPSSLHSTVSVARRSLGSARDGSDHLPRSHGRLALADTVGTDWGRFQELAASGNPDVWEEALTLVRGRPFEGIRSTDWALLDGTAPAIEAAVVDLSGRLAGARLRSGDPHRAEWAARRGLLVSPYDERLYRMLLRTADSAGNPGGVEAVMAELVRVVADEVEPVESVHPSTLALYRSLSRRNHQALRAASATVLR
jgi:hypothetical protein